MLKIIDIMPQARAEAPQQQPQPYVYKQLHMAMAVEITVYADSRKQAEAAALAGFAQFSKIDGLMNDYLPDTEISKLSDHAGLGPQKVSPEMLTCIKRASEVYQLSQGAFDPTIAPLARLWRNARKTKILPTTQEIDSARKLVGMNDVAFNEKQSTVELKRLGMRLDFGGIAKGYACDLAGAAIEKEGISSWMVQAGGDLKVGNPPPEKTGWTIDLPDHDPIDVHNTAVSISGDLSQYVIIDGNRYSHVIDPHTGIGLTSRKMSVIISPDGLWSDPLAKAACIMDKDAFDKLAASMKNTKAMVFIAKKDE